MVITQNACKKCGNCCKKGGPALHSGDVNLVQNSKLPISSLITIRKGELAHNPLVNRVQPVENELVKIIGTGRAWDCCYYDNDSGCTIYDSRPESCRVLECWNTGKSQELIEHDTLSRLDILGEDHPLVPVIRQHEKVCSCEGLGYIRDNYNSLSVQRKTEVEKLVRADLRFRERVINDYELKLSDELFYFGRPFFQLLQPLGVRVSESQGTINLHW